jgi:hypothetical protein
MMLIVSGVSIVITTYIHCLGIQYAILWKTIYDMAHGLANNMGDLFETFLNTGSMFFSNKRRSFETQTLFRFEGFAARERMPWMCPTASLSNLKKIDEKRLLKVPIGWVPMFNLSAGVPSKVYITLYVL